MTKEAEIGKQIFIHVGGMENVSRIAHCMTRVRLGIVDSDLVDVAGLKKVPGVIGVVEDDTLQIIVGPGVVNKVAGAMAEMAGVKIGETIQENLDSGTKTGKELVEEKASKTKAELKAKQNNSSGFKRLLKSISNIFVPLIPGFVGAGLIAGIAAIISNNITAGNLDAAVWTQYIDILGVINKGIFAFLAIYVGINTANEFGGTPVLGGGIAGITLLSGLAEGHTITNIFTGDPIVAGQGGIIGVLLAVWLMCVLEKNLRKIIPNAIDIIFTPTLVLLIIGLVTIFLIMPFAGLVSDGLVNGINWVIEVGGVFAGFVLGTLFLPMVMFGLHQVLTPIHVEMIAQNGYTILLPILAMAGGGQVGAAIALWIRCRKNKPLVNMIKGGLPVGILGIGEPLIYGVTIPLGKPFLTACLGGGIGGAVIGYFGNVGAIAIGPSGVALIPLIANNEWLSYVIGLIAAYLGGFILTYFFGTPKDAMNSVEL
ncbi:PTS transporter subunit EIIC [Listeria monocytogenes]|mgnify:CR=1 FL=1|uniref:PTS system EIIBC component n=10 Tax=Listeria monocytogenes TaxID=1639 RepID=A0A0B8R8T3_LISMN|nr:MULTISPECIES: PTS transporter subunit EIIC [Listeria]EAE3705414.1 permease [Listeria monocytogenes serotype 1/2b]EAF4526387.1 permease [Listeria monocytogenes serotype 1/2a]EAG6331455.1 permease [Listeria monocytogenes CFSAN002346]EAG6348889.1 permease [Listeria monocytogenes LIS0102]EAG6366089.1 permease [Listeria monocytogenes LIS0063]EAG6375943.1 permease [Listeria monocytogenes CFSAN002355]EEP3936607.1 PTS transporter subunit EIIC [Listeria monocytogenes serotype 7]EGC3053655.1 PTS t